MKAIVRKDNEAVSPVIATILMVAITVVLAAVLYVMVSGLISSPGSQQKQVVGTIASSGGNWIITITSASSGVTNSQVTLTVTNSDGTSTNATGTGILTALTMASNGIVYQHPSGSTTVGAADTILLSQLWWSSGHRITLTFSSQIVYGPATLQ